MAETPVDSLRLLIANAMAELAVAAAKLSCSVPSLPLISIVTALVPTLAALFASLYHRAVSALTSKVVRHA